MMTLHNHWKVNLLQGQVFGTACYHKIHYNVDILHLYTNVLMMKTNQVSSFFHDQIGHVYLKFTISDHMVNNRLCNLTPPGSFEHTFVFLFCFLMFEELRHFIIVSIARKGKWITKNKHKNAHFLISDGVQGTRIWKNSFFRGGAQQQQLYLPLLWALKQLYTLHLLHFPHKLQPAYCKTKLCF